MTKAIPKKGSRKKVRISLRRNARIGLHRNAVLVYERVHVE